MYDTSANGSPGRSRAGVDRRLPTRVLRGLADHHRRLVLGAILDRGTPVSEATLVRALAARDPDGDGASDGTPEERRDRTRIRLHHADLPVLDAVGLIEWDPREGLVVRADDPAYDHPTFRWLVDGPAGFDPGVVDANLELLASDRGRTVLDVLATRGRLDLADLARRVVTREGGRAAVGDGTVTRTLVALVHSSLPRLVETGAVELPTDGREVVYTGNPFLEAWREVAPEARRDP